MATSFVRKYRHSLIVEESKYLPRSEFIQYCVTNKLASRRFAKWYTDYRENLTEKDYAEVERLYKKSVSERGGSHVN